MPKKAAKKTLSDMTLIWLSVFFVLVSVFVVLMYYRQQQMVGSYLRLQTSQQNQILKPSATPKATVTPKGTVKPTIKK